LTAIDNLATAIFFTTTTTFFTTLTTLTMKHEEEERGKSQTIDTQLQRLSPITVKPEVEIEW
jgi:hypothetical protein